MNLMSYEYLFFKHLRNFNNRNMTINTYFVKMLLKTILKMSYHIYTGVDTAFEKS